MPRKAPQDVVSLSGAQRILRLRYDRMQYLAETGKLKGQRINKTWRFNREDVVNWLRTGEPIVMKEFHEWLRQKAS